MGAMIYRWRQRLADADQQTNNAWLLIAILIVALACTMETMISVASSSMLVVDALCACANVATLIYMAFRPASGALIASALWIALCCAPVKQPSATLLSILVAIGILGYAFRRISILVTVIALSVWLVTQGNIASSNIMSDPSDHTLFGTVSMTGVTPVIVLFAAALFAGMAARWNHERHTTRMELAYRRKQARTARDIHDYVSNDLAYLILRLDKSIADGHNPSIAELHELRDVASGALERTHEVINLIEDRTNRTRNDDTRGIRNTTVPNRSAVQNSGPASPAVSVDCPLAARARIIAHNGDYRLAELGFNGQTIISNTNTDAEPDDLVFGLLEELYGNIAKHADPQADYILTISIGNDTVTIALADTALTSATTESPSAASHSLGTGLSRYRNLLAERGGTLIINNQPDREWSMLAQLPI